MRAGASALLATGKAALVDLVTLTVPRILPVIQSGPPSDGTVSSATILGDTYQTVMLDGKEFLKENYRTISLAGRGSWWGGGSSNDGDGRYFYKGSALDECAAIGGGWRLPTLDEWRALQTLLGGASVAGGKLKATGTTYWNAPNTGATDEFGFGLRGAGYYQQNAGTWAGKKTSGYYWAQDVEPDGVSFFCFAYALNTSAELAIGSTGAVHLWQFPMRLVRDYVSPAPSEPTAVIRWTSHDRPLRFQGAEFQGLPGSVWTRGGRSDQAGSEVSSLACSVAGDLVVPWRTHPTETAQVDLIDLSELAVLGLLEGATLQIDEAVLDAFPNAPAGEAAAELPIDQVTTAVALGEVVEASLDALSVQMRLRSAQHRGGASVPRSVFAPTCRWDFAGPECGYASQVSSRTCVSATEETITLSAIQVEDFASATPLAGRNMGIRRTLGVGQQDGLERTYALPTAWPWPLADGTEVAVAFECSKAFQSLTGRPSCNALLRQAQFGGFAGMPPPEGA